MEYELKLSGQEIEMLFQALESWEKETMGNALLTGILGAVLSRNEDEAAENREKTMSEAEQQTLVRKRSSILLKAKLISALDDCAAQELFRKK